MACGTAVPISEGVVGFENNVFLLVKLLLILAPCFLSVSLSTSSLSNTSHIVSRHPTGSSLSFIFFCSLLVISFPFSIGVGFVSICSSSSSVIRYLAESDAVTMMKGGSCPSVPMILGIVSLNTSLAFLPTIYVSMNRTSLSYLLLP